MRSPRGGPVRVLLQLGAIAVLSAWSEASGAEPVPARGAITASFAVIPIEPTGPLRTGRFFFSTGDGWWRTDYASPVEQTMTSTDTLTVIVYPRQEKAFVIHTALLDPPSSIFFFMMAMATNEELARVGMQIVDFDVARDTTITTWRVPAPDDAAPGGTVAVRRVGRGIVRMDSLGRQGERRRFTVDAAEEIAGERVPRIVRLEEWGPEGRTEVRIEYSELGAATVNPAELFSVTVPPGYEVKESSW